MFYLCSVWGTCREGDRNGAVEEFETREEAEKGLEQLLDEHPDARWKLIQGEEVKRG